MTSFQLLVTISKFRNFWGESPTYTTVLSNMMENYFKIKNVHLLVPFQ